MNIHNRTVVSLTWFGIGLLVFIGAVSSVNRGAALTTGSLLFDPLRPTLPPSALEEVEQYDEAFVKNRSFTLLHIITGSIFLFAAPIQLSSYIRKHHIGVHRWCGRITIVISLAAGISA